MTLQITLNLLIFSFFAWITLELAYTDHVSNRLPNRLTISLMAVGLTINLTGFFVPWIQAALGCAVSYLGFRLYHDIQLYRRGVSGIGLGDAKYLAALAAWFGIQAVPFLLVGASICSLVGYRHRSEIPFGVGLSISAIGAWVYAAMSVDLL